MEPSAIARNFTDFGFREAEQQNGENNPMHSRDGH